VWRRVEVHLRRDHHEQQHECAGRCRPSDGLGREQCQARLILTDSTGRTLYVFDRDKGGTIACTASCVQVWPPLLLTAGTSAPTAGAGVTTALASVQRPDGGLQVTSGGRPLYAFSVTRPLAIRMATDSTAASGTRPGRPGTL